MPTGTMYDTTKHQFTELPNDSVICRYCKQSATNAIHFRPAPGSGERWITREEAEGPVEVELAHAEGVR